MEEGVIDSFTISRFSHFPENHWFQWAGARGGTVAGAKAVCGILKVMALSRQDYADHAVSNKDRKYAYYIYWILFQSISLVVFKLYWEQSTGWSSWNTVINILENTETTFTVDYGFLIGAHDANTCSSAYSLLYYIQACVALCIV